MDTSGGHRAAAAGAIILIVMQFLLAFLLTSPENSWFRSFGTKTINYGGNISHRFVSRVRPSNNNTNDPMTEKELPRQYDSEADIGESTSPRTEFEPATALHGYQGNPTDPAELSFNKNEKLEILDKHGNWWRARKQDGTVGIVPSNYVSVRKNE